MTILDLEQDPIAFFPNPIDVVQFYIPRLALEEFAYENRTATVNTLRWPYCEMDTTLKHLGMAVLSAMQQAVLHKRCSWTTWVKRYLHMPLTSTAELRLLQSSPEANLRLGRRDEQKSS